MEDRIYLDHAATTPLDPEVIQVMQKVMEEDFGNPSSIYAEGRKARMIIENARKSIAQGIHASIGEIFFTSCGTEANNMALKNAVRDLKVKHIISSPTEHHNVTHALKAIQRDYGTEVSFLDVNANGQIDLHQLEVFLNAGSQKTMVSLMHVNNEIGTIHPIKEIARLCKDYDALFHSDTVQSIGSLPINVQETPITFLSSSAHKLNGPKGIGFIYINSNHLIKPMLDGGSQERNMRGGTENTIHIAGFAKAFNLAINNMDARRQHILRLRNRLIEGLTDQFDDISILGDYNGTSHYKIINVSFPNNPKTALLLFNLDIQGISASGGSACSSGVESGSHVLEAIGFPQDRKAVRFSLSHTNTDRDIDYLLMTLKKLL